MAAKKAKATPKKEPPAPQGQVKARSNEATRFKPGQSGNPGGMPKGYVSLTTLIRAELQKADRNGKTNAQKLIERLIKDAVAGQFAKAKEILDRHDGKVPDRIAGPQGEPLIDRAQQTAMLRDPEAARLACQLARLIVPASVADPDQDAG